MEIAGSQVVYGASSEQWYEWYEPALNVPPKGVVVLVHGGFWRQRHALGQMHPLAQFFLAQGWVVANIEYRRGSEGQWPLIINDVKQAFASIREKAHQQGVDKVVGIGHSVGGQLVLLSADYQDVTVALAPVTDVQRTKDEALGENAAVDFFGDRLDQVNEEASPIHQPAAKAKTLVIHGDEDDRVPLAHSVDYVAKLNNSGASMELWELEGIDHFVIINPACQVWPKVVEYLEQ